MKLLAAGFLCLSIFVSFSSCQTPLSKTFIQYRAEIIKQNFRWYQKLDASYFEFYEELRDKLRKIFQPFKSAFRDLNEAYGNFSQDGLSPDTSKNFTSLVTRVNQTLFYTSEYADRMALMQYSMSLMMPDFLSPSASALKNALQMSLSSIFNLFTMTMTPPLDSCAKKVLSQVVPTYEPYAKKLQASAKQGIAEIPSAFKNVTMAAKAALAELGIFTNKIKSCSQLASRQKCADEINQEYVVCGDLCTFEKTISKPMAEVSMATMALQKIYPSMPMISGSMELNDKMTKLKSLCEK